MSNSSGKNGLAVLVGAGPGEAGLITVEGRQWLARAEVVLYDRLAAADLLKACPTGTERIYVGKEPGAPARTQGDICSLLVEHCRAGKLVVRLKGGDPLIFGRGGEEADALAEAGLPYRIVPGITAGIAAGACAGIPLTDRRVASTVTFVTGHEDPAKDESAIDYDALARLHTLVFYMGVGNLPSIAEKLIAAGRDGETPVAVVQNAARPGQRTLVATLATVAEEARSADIRPPAVVIVGQAARFRERLGWMEKLPLWGRTVLVTRTRRQASRLSARLVELGANALECPTIEIRPPDDWYPLDDALDRLDDFDWLVLTSPNGAHGVVSRMRKLGLDGRCLAGIRIAAVGPATADVLRRSFIEPDLLPERFTTTALGEALTAELAGAHCRCLLARADIATPDLPNLLLDAGAEVEEVTAYRTVPPDALPEEALEALHSGTADWITFTSSSTVDNFMSLLAGEGLSLEGIRLASIGPVTSRTLGHHGLTPDAEADRHTIDGLIDALLATVQNEADGDQDQ